MKLKSFLPVIAILTIVLLLSFNDFEKSSISKYHSKDMLKYSSGAPAGKTGAPGEGTCVNCHTGNVLNGASQNEFTFSEVANEYTTGQSYTIDISTDSPGSANGFQIVALNAANENIGTLSSGVGSNAIVDGSKIYITHSTSSLSAWTINWEAPDAYTGPVTFYLATNKANNNGTQSGDLIFNSQHVINSSIAGIYFNEYANLNENVNMMFNPSQRTINISYALGKASSITHQLVDLSGKVVAVNSIGMVGMGKNEHSIEISSNIKKGAYISTLFIDNHSFTRMLSIN
jgi:hypothetical protein